VLSTILRKKGAIELEHEADGRKEKISDSEAEVEADTDTSVAHNEAEELLVQRLTEGQLEQNSPEDEAVKALPPRWEIRIQTDRDPIAEETKVYRSIAREVDDRYDDKNKGQPK
jgi:hypothetical protein